MEISLILLANECDKIQDIKNISDDDDVNTDTTEGNCLHLT